MIEIWVKPNGTEVPINSDNHQAARQLGWVPKSEPKEDPKDEVKAEPKRRGRPPKG